MPNTCIHCKKPILLEEYHYCPYCGTSQSETQHTRETTHHPLSLSSSPPILIPGHIPQAEEVQFSIGPYQILKSIGKGEWEKFF